MRASILILSLLVLATPKLSEVRAEHTTFPEPPNISSIPSGDIAGAAQSDAGATIRNPLEGKSDAIAEGKRLFSQMNCAGCHGYTLGGSMGPNLADRYWRYGGTPGAIYRSIADGHPQGMPAWRRALPPDEIWKLVAYIQSYGGTIPAADYQNALQGDTFAKSSAGGSGTGAQAGAQGATARSAQTTTP